MLTVILNALGDFVQFSDGKESKSFCNLSLNLLKVLIYTRFFCGRWYDLFIFAMCNLMIKFASSKNARGV